jgi:hypothetical protein
MTTLALKECHIPKNVRPTIAIRLFRHLALDLKLSEEPEVLRAVGLLTSRKYKSFLSLTGSWAAQKYGSSDKHFAWNQLSCLLKKYPFVDESIDTQSAAMKKFFKAEHTCKRVNARFVARRKRRSTPVTVWKPLPYESYLHSARRYIQQVLGVTPEFAKIWDMCDFGPGASVGVSGTATHKGVKLESDWTVTPLAAPYARAAMIGDHHIWELLTEYPVCFDKHIFTDAFDEKLRFVKANNIITVPKTALVDRTIAIEPVLNGYLQKGVDKYMRRRLKRFSIDLSDQGKNQHLAKLGSQSGFNPLCTIDLSAASDSISKELVKELLPPDWYAFLNDLRSHYFNIDGTETRYEKFTSMGNGFCFPLESLIFAALVHSVYEVTGDRVFSIYGDDIIVQQSSALLVLEILKYCGFSANVDKTFIHGPFRESCGADYFEGVNVRPYYLDSIPVKWYDIFGILNGLRCVLDTRISKAWWSTFYMVPEKFRYVRHIDGPDTAIIVEKDVFLTSQFTKWHIHEQRWTWRELLRTPVSDMAAYKTATMMYGVVRNARARQQLRSRPERGKTLASYDALGLVDYTHRRMTVTRTRKC